MTFQEFEEAVRKAALRDDGIAPVFGIDPETRRLWKATSGNAKARRRWRRRNVPNAQRLERSAR